jgi:hypothetical protein
VNGGGHRQQAIDLLDRAAHRHGRGRPAVGDTLGERADVLVDRDRIAVPAREQTLQALRGVGRLVLRHLCRPDLRTGHVVDRQLVLLLRERLEVVLAYQDQQVARDHLLRLEAIDGDLVCLGQSGAEGRFVGRPAIGPEVGPAIAVALVSQDRGGQWIAFEDAFPETVGEVVDGCVRIGDDGHGGPLRFV